MSFLPCHRNGSYTKSGGKIKLNLDEEIYLKEKSLKEKFRRFFIDVL